jgi:pimeloyl-ACP methyl ester carboxylesterase
MIELIGLLKLLGVALAIIIAGGTFVLLRALLRPHRKTIGHALAKGLPTQPEEIGLEGEEVTFHYGDATSAPGWIVRGQSRDGPVTVLTHGWSSGRFAMLDLAPLFTPYCSKVVVYDMRGHGESTAPRCLHGGKEIDDLLAVLDQVDDEGRGYVLYGTSLGAGFALVAGSREARRGGERIKGVIVEGPYQYPLRPIIGQLHRRGAPGFPMAHLALAHLAFWHGVGEEYDRALHAGRLTCPLLVLHGTADDICPIEGGRKIAAAAKRGRIIEFPGANHSHLAEHDPQRYAAALEAFFKEVGSLGAMPSRSVGM